MINGAPKFKKIVLLLKLGGTKDYDENDSLRDLDLQRTTKITMEDSSIVITGDYLIITKDGVSNNTKETTSKIYNLSEIDSYRLYND
jgi:hypothetical protein|tara:strand:- start:1005 stop:1265 length:261 start_codon:yes stop_codon:yes gene_type:complete